MQMHFVPTSVSPTLQLACGCGTVGGSTGTSCGEFFLAGQVLQTLLRKSVKLEIATISEGRPRLLGKIVQCTIKIHQFHTYILESASQLHEGPKKQLCFLANISAKAPKHWLFGATRRPPQLEVSYEYHQQEIGSIWLAFSAKGADSGRYQYKLYNGIQNTRYIYIYKSSCIIVLYVGLLIHLIRDLSRCPRVWASGSLDGPGPVLCW